VAGAVGGYAVLQVDPAIVAHEVLPTRPGYAEPEAGAASRASATTTEDVRVAFGS